MNKNTERIDDLQLGGLRILQNPELFCFGMDAVLLSTFAKVNPGERVLDLCSGNGVIPLLLAGKTQAAHITGVEIQPQVAQMAAKSVTLNGLDERIRILCGDLKEFSEPSGYEVVTCNPPYMAGGGGPVNPKDAKALARHEISCTLEDVICRARDSLVSQGRFYMVHRPRRLVDILSLLRASRMEPKRMRFVHSYIDKEPTLVLIESVRNGGTQLIVEAPLIVYEAPGVYTEELKEWYYGSRES